MKSIAIVVVASLALTAVTLFVSHSIGAPFVPVGRDLPDEIYSLAGLDAVEMALEAIPPELAHISADLETLFANQLEAAGIVVKDDPGLPRLVLQIQASTDPKVPEALAFAIVLALHQPVMVERLKSQLDVPTVSVSWVRQTTKADAPRTVPMGVRFVLNFFANEWQKASAAWDLREAKGQ